MNSKRAKQLRKESKVFSEHTGLDSDVVYKHLKKTSKGVFIKSAHKLNNNL